MFCQRRISRSFSEESAQLQQHTDITSSLMEKFVLLLVLLSPAASDVVQVKPGDDVTLPCHTGEASISNVEWSRPDLEPEYVLLYRDGHSDPALQHPSLKDRVQLVDRELKDGDVSLILKNVSSNDAGTYECRVAAGGSRRKRSFIEAEPIRIIQLEVSDVVRVKPGDDVTLPCQAGEASIRAAEWSRPDLRPDCVLRYRDGHTDPAHQHPSLKDRVQLVDSKVKDGDVSLILKKVSSNDAGTYECRVAAGGSRRKRAILDGDPISIIQLEVSGGDQEGVGEKRADTDGGNKEGGGKEGNVGPMVGLTVFAVLLVAVAVVGTMIFKKRRGNTAPPGEQTESLNPPTSG